MKGFFLLFPLSLSFFIQPVGKEIVYTAKLIEETRGMRGDIKEMIEETRECFEKLPERIAKVLKESK